MRFNVVFNRTDQKIPVKFNSSKSFDANFKGFLAVAVKQDIEYYEGDYVITPKVDAQTFPTAQKAMSSDLTVKAIPYYDVSNTAGGQTIYIGNEVFMNGD